MARDFDRSDKTNAIVKLLSVKHRMTFTVSLPNVGRMTLRGDALKEFIWTLRSQHAERLLESWVDKLHDSIEDAKASFSLAQEVSDAKTGAELQSVLPRTNEGHGAFADRSAAP